MIFGVIKQMGLNNDLSNIRILTCNKQHNVFYVLLTVHPGTTLGE